MSIVVQIIRHGEKPTGSTPGISPTGKEDPHSLTQRGWARATALVGLFNPAGDLRSGLARPTRIYAADGPNAGERMKQTVSKLASSLGFATIMTFDKGQESQLAKALKATPDGEVVLVCWEHSEIPAINKALGSVTPKPRSSWSDSDFSTIEVFESSDGGKSWTYHETSEAALPGDPGYQAPIPVPPVVIPPPTPAPVPDPVPVPPEPTPEPPAPAPAPAPEPLPIPVPTPPNWWVRFIEWLKKLFS